MVLRLYRVRLITLKMDHHIDLVPLAIVNLEGQESKTVEIDDSDPVLFFLSLSLTEVF